MAGAPAQRKHRTLINTDTEPEVKPTLIKHKYSGKVMEVIRETDLSIIYGRIGNNLIDRWVMSRNLFEMKWDYYNGPVPTEEEPTPLPDLPSEIGAAGPKPEKRGRGRPKGSKNKPKGEAA